MLIALVNLPPEQTTQVEWATLNCHVTTQADDKAHKTEQYSRSTSGWQSKLCLRVIWMCPSMLIRHDLDVGAGGDACLQIPAQCGLVQCCCHGNLYTTELCECFHVISSVKFPNIYSVCSSSLRLSHSVRTVVSYLSKRHFNASWPCL